MYTQLKVLQQGDELLRILAKGRLAIQEFFTKLADDIGKWFLKNKEVLLTAFDKIALESWKVLAKFFKTEKVIKATNGAEVLCFSFNKALVPVNKILMYARGKVRDVENLVKLEKELAELRYLKQTARKVFDKDPLNEKRLEELKEVLVRNAKKAISKKERFEKMGFPDNEANNKKIFELILADLNKSVNKLKPHPNNFVRSILKTTKGQITLECYWVKLPNGKYYMSTIIVK